jgi:hypothetical protein
MQRKDGSTLSAIEPVEYGRRYVEFMTTKVFK